MTDPVPAEPQPSHAGAGGRMARNASFLALGQVGTTTLAIFFSAALGRALGAHDFGLYFLATSMVSFAYVFVEWGQPLLVVRETAREPDQAGRLLGTAFVLRLVGGAIVFLPMLSVAVLLRYDARTLWLVALFYGAMFPTLLAQSFGMVFRGRDRMDRDALILVVSRAASLVLVLAAFARGGGLLAVALTQCAAGFVSLALGSRFYRGLGAPPMQVRRDVARSLVVAGTPIIAMNAASAVQAYLDAVILSKLVPADAMGWYGVAKTILGTLVAPAIILGSASFPQLSRTFGQQERFGETVRAALRPMLVFGALGAAGTYLFAGTAVEIIYGKAGYAPAATILKVFSPGMFLLFVDVLLGHVLLAAGRAKGFAIAKVASVVVSTALDFVLIPWFQARYGNGGIGVVVAFAASEFVVFAGAIGFLPARTLNMRYALDAGRAVLAAVGTVFLMSRMSGLPALVGIPFCVAVFGAIAYALGLIHRSDVEFAAAFLRRRSAAQPSTDA